MATSEQNWKDVGDQLGALALKLKLHVEQGQSATGEQLETSLRALKTAVDDTFTALRGAAKDAALEDDVRKVGQSLTDALFNTFSEIGARYGKAFEWGDGDKGGDTAGEAEDA